jgi:hypothetical protein
MNMLARDVTRGSEVNDGGADPMSSLATCRIKDFDKHRFASHAVIPSSYKHLQARAKGEEASGGTSVVRSGCSGLSLGGL